MPNGKQYRDFLPGLLVVPRERPAPLRGDLGVLLLGRPQPVGPLQGPTLAVGRVHLLQKETHLKGSETIESGNIQGT